jgi:hypothetical protein
MIEASYSTPSTIRRSRSAALPRTLSAAWYPSLSWAAAAFFDAVEFDDYDPLDQPRFIGSRRSSASQESPAGGRNRRPGELGITGQRLRVRNRTISRHPIRHRHHHLHFLGRRSERTLRRASAKAKLSGRREPGQGERLAAEFLWAPAKRMRDPMAETKSGRAHLIAGGFPPGSMAGHDPRSWIASIETIPTTL